MADEPGRPSVMTDDVLNKLNEAFALGCTDEEACIYADISPRTLYNYQKNNEDFLQRKELLKQRPVLLAKQKVVNDISTDTNTAKWYLERKAKQEFSPRNELTGAEGQALKLSFDPAFNGTTSETEGNSQESGEVQDSQSR